MQEIYAKVLWKMVERGMQPKKAAGALHEMLMRLGRVSLFPKISRVFVRIAERDLARNGVVLSVARKKDERVGLKAIKDILREMNVDSKDVTTRVDDALIGGWRLEGKELLVDASYKKYLLGMYNRATRI